MTIGRFRAICLLAAAFVLLFVPAVLGPSAAAPPLGPKSVLPPYDLGLTPPSGLVVVLLAGGYALAAAGLWQGLKAIREGWEPRAIWVALVAGTATLIAVLVPPFGSADHLSYAAYGRIAALGGNPYVTAPDQWPHPDAVISAVEAPWEGTTSVYGPIATALFEVLARIGGGSLPLTVWLMQLTVGLAFLVTGFVLLRLAGNDGRGRARVALLWLANPALLAVLVGGAHLDTLAVAAGVTGTALLILTRKSRARIPLWLLGGAVLALAVGTKLPYLAMAAAAWWAVHRRPPAELAALTTSAWWAGRSCCCRRIPGRGRTPMTRHSRPATTSRSPAPGAP